MKNIINKSQYKLSNIKTFDNLYVKKKKQRGGAKTIANNFNDYVNSDNRIIYKFDITKDNKIIKSYFIKIIYYSDPYLIRNVVKLNNLLKKSTLKREEEIIKKLEISTQEIGPGYHETIFYKKIYNLNKSNKLYSIFNKSNEIKLIKPISYGFINYSNLTDEIIIENNVKICINDFIKNKSKITKLNSNNKDYYSFLITEYNPSYQTYDTVSELIKQGEYSTKCLEDIKRITSKILNHLYKEYRFIHCDLHPDNLLINSKNINNLKTNDIIIFDFDFSQIGGIKNIGLLYNVLIDDIYKPLQLLKILNFPIKIPSILYPTSQNSFKDLTEFKLLNDNDKFIKYIDKTEINQIKKVKKNNYYTELLHAFDMYRYIDNSHLDIDIVKELINKYNITDTFNIELLENYLMDDEYTKLLLINLYLYIKDYPNSILTNLSNISKNTQTNSNIITLNNIKNYSYNSNNSNNSNVIILNNINNSKKFKYSKLQSSKKIQSDSKLQSSKKLQTNSKLQSSKKLQLSSKLQKLQNNNLDFTQTNYGPLQNLAKQNNAKEKERINKEFFQAYGPLQNLAKQNNAKEKERINKEFFQAYGPLQNLSKENNTESK